MPHFCECGADEYICQKCARVFCSKDFMPSWETLTPYGRQGNKCPSCPHTMFVTLRDVTLRDEPEGHEFSSKIGVVVGGYKDWMDNTDLDKTIFYYYDSLNEIDNLKPGDEITDKTFLVSVDSEPKQVQESFYNS